MIVHCLSGSMKYRELQSAFLSFLAWACLYEPSGWEAGGGTSMRLWNQGTAFAGSCELVDVLHPSNQERLSI